MSIRKFEKQDKRVETGAIQFGDDWPGVFFRGDDAMYYAMNLKACVDHESYIKEPMARSIIEGLIDYLERCDVRKSSD